MLKPMIRISAALSLLIATALFSVAVAQEDGEHKKHHQDKDKEIAWFDMDHCEICKNMSSVKNQMHKIGWEIHMLENGMVSAAKVPDDMKEKMSQVEKGVQQTVARLEKGEQLDMCGYCMNYGRLMSLGAKFQKVDALGVNLSIVTSDDEEVVKEIHAMGKRAKAEHEKMLKKVKPSEEK